MEMRLLGRSGLMVSEFSFGTMTFGNKDIMPAIGETSLPDAERLVGICIDAGINLFDTADIYSDGRSEEVLGAALGKRRQDVLVATKVYQRMGPGANQLGLSRQHIIAACEASLKRLNTDYIDLYQSHGYDSITPVEETMRAYDDLITAGKVRYIGCSNHAGWHLMKTLSVADRLGVARYISQQIDYSLVDRDPEWELVPLGLDQGVGIMAYSPLASGLLSGKYRPDAAPSADARAMAITVPQDTDRERLYRIVQAMDEIAQAHDVPVAQVAINFIRQRPGVSTVILGAKNEKQLQANLAAAAWTLSAEEISRLDAASAQVAPYPYWHLMQRTGARNPYYANRPDHARPKMP